MKIARIIVLIFAFAATYANEIKSGFFSEEVFYGENWKKYGLYDMLKQNGILGNAENSMSWIYGKTSEEKIYQAFSKYHVIIISIDRAYKSENYRQTTQNYSHALERYLKAGGGALIIAQNGEYHQDKRPDVFNIIFGKYGAEMSREGINDINNEYYYPNHPFLKSGKNKAPAYLNFFITRNIAKTPVTKGVNTLFFPQFGSGGAWATTGLKFSKEWTVAVKGEKTACSYLPQGGSKDGVFQNKGSIASEPPLVAFRNYGAGRLAVIACDRMHLTINAKAIDWPGVFEYCGDGRTPSDGHKLLLNLLKYLSASAQNNPQLGTYTEKQIVQTDNQILNIDKKHFPAPQPLSKGIIGIHSAYSDGKGNVSEYAIAAKKAGFDFIAFTEALEKLTPEKFKQLKQECQKISDGKFYACPGIEFSDRSSLRWAFWGEDTIYPTNEVLMPQNPNIVGWPGLYAALCNRRPSALLNYSYLHKIGNPANLWWYFRVPVSITKNGSLIADNFKEYMFALQDIRGVGPVAISNIYSPDKLSCEKTVNYIYGKGMNVKNALNTKNSFGYNQMFVSSGPEIRLWSSINSNTSVGKETSGWQRVRMKFNVFSENGIKETAVYDGTSSELFRRFDGKGNKNFSCEFEAVRDKTHYLVLKVTDMAGNTAISAEQRIINPYYAITRCSDNMNLLGYSTLLMYPNHHQIPSCRNFEDIGSARSDEKLLDKTVIAGIDTGTPFLFMPRAEVNFNFSTDKGAQLGGSNKLDDFNAVKQLYPLNSNEISILQQDSEKRINTSSRHKGKKRTTYAYASLFPITGEQPIANIKHTAYLLQSKIEQNLRFTKPWLAEDNYRGGVMLHEVIFTFNRDVTLKGEQPISFIALSSGTSYFSAANGYWDTITASLTDKDTAMSMQRMNIPLKNKGFAVISSKKSHRKIMVAFHSRGAAPNLRADSASNVFIGLGKNGQHFRKGDTITLNFAVATVAEKENSPEYFRKLSQNILAEEIKWKTEKGTVKKRFGFAAADAKNFETVIKFEKTHHLCDYPVAVSGISDNGCTAFCDISNNKFTFVPVSNGTLYFQVSADVPIKIWAGNIFASANKNLKITYVAEGHSRTPFIEIHNPSYSDIQTEIFSPENTPVYGGKRFSVSIKAGNSMKIQLNREKK